MTDNCLAIDEVANHLAISTRTVARLIAAGALPSVKIGRRRVIRASVLNAFLDNHGACAG